MKYKGVNSKWNIGMFCVVRSVVSVDGVFSVVGAVDGGGVDGDRHPGCHDNHGHGTRVRGN